MTPRRTWLFDLDDTLHAASAASMGELRDAMRAYIATHLRITDDEAAALRNRYWQRYGATLLGLVRHHGVQAAHFLHHTHLLPGLEQRVRGHRADQHQNPSPDDRSNTKEDEMGPRQRPLQPMLLRHILPSDDRLADVPVFHSCPPRHCEPFDAACGVAQDKLREAIQRRNWIAAPLRGSQ